MFQKMSITNDANILDVLLCSLKEVDTKNVSLLWKGSSHFLLFMVCLMCSNVLASFKTSQQFISITLHEAWQVESPPKAPQSCHGKNFVLQNFFLWNLLTLQGFRGAPLAVAFLAPKFCKQKTLLLPMINCLIGSFSYSYFFFFYRYRCFAHTLTL